jgi:hypothetical protein
MKIRPLRIKRRIRYEIEFSNVRCAQEVPEASESDEEENIERMTSGTVMHLYPTTIVMPKDILLALSARISRMVVYTIPSRLVLERQVHVSRMLDSLG